MSFVLTPQGVKSWPLAGMLPPNVFLPQTRSIDLLGLNKNVSYEMIYRTQPWVYVAVNKIARGLARLPLTAYGPDGKELPPDSELQTLLDRPFPRGSGFNLREATTGSLAIYGNSLTVKDRGDTPFGPVKALWSVPWRFVTPIMGENEPIAAYLVLVAGVRRIFFPDDVIHHQWWSPDGLLGVSPLEPLRVTLALEDAAQRYAVSSFANGGRPSGAVSTEKPMNKPDRDALRAELESTYAGVDNAFRIALLTHGLQWQAMSHSAVESDLINQREFTRDEVFAVYDINPVNIGISGKGGGSRAANVEEIHTMLYQDTFGPWATMEEQTWNIQLCGNERAFRGMTVKHDMGEFLRGNTDKRSSAAQRWFQSATKTPNELREDEDLPPVPGSMLASGEPDPDHYANNVYVPVNMIAGKDIEEGIDLQQQPSPDAGGTGGDVPSAQEVRSFLRLAAAAGMDIPGLLKSEPVEDADV
jgi:HK97 family phage portal protein